MPDLARFRSRPTGRSPSWARRITPVTLSLTTQFAIASGASPPPRWRSTWPRSMMRQSPWMTRWSTALRISLCASASTPCSPTTLTWMAKLKPKICGSSLSNPCSISMELPFIPTATATFRARRPTPPGDSMGAMWSSSLGLITSDRPVSSIPLPMRLAEPRPPVLRSSSHRLTMRPVPAISAMKSG